MQRYTYMKVGQSVVLTDHITGDELVLQGDDYLNFLNKVMLMTKKLVFPQEKWSTCSEFIDYHISQYF
ncbi:hypothetical protein VF06_34585 [Nostoc linckia z4]|jgi:hypothetical protein|uniref:Uncharacterized protein n=2 Tax=Nostoc linckia TaxID=92942 RepID=A0A9Q5ZBI7_NOSLI|nr:MULTISPECIES: hypothetical protein [Nostoc]PHK42337.1 hypothetical protein VF13_29740 [Nostoc linckia z16]MBC1237932.1 hypothetical protein [Nostoc sp. 2RC]PHJ58394.1 hypothetical protein VF02_27780 [Nostoc linckia z1]PHJ65892.1 hypothetical protein VF03_27160 [Nostoc linckia z2]PHJ70547.1 hypothetical protein VF05_10660 [Nostoc linckia z3]